MPEKSDKVAENAAVIGKTVQQAKKVPSEQEEANAKRLAELEAEIKGLKDSIIISQKEKEVENEDAVQIYDCRKKAVKAAPVRGTVNYGGGFAQG